MPFYETWIAYYGTGVDDDAIRFLSSEEYKEDREKINHLLSTVVTKMRKNQTSLTITKTKTS
jgi:hypothetical protein